MGTDNITNISKRVNKKCFFFLIFLCATIIILVLGQLAATSFGLARAVAPIDSHFVAGCSSERLAGMMESPLQANWSSAIWDGIDVDLIKTIRGQVHRRAEESRHVSQPVNRAFHPMLNATYRELMHRLLVVFVDIARGRNLTYFLYGGSLIGSFRHHGLIPWDDDVDVIVYDKQRKLLKAAFAALSKPYKGVVLRSRWKLTYDNLPAISKQYTWSFPFLDISFFTVTQDYVIDKDPGWSRKGFKYKISDVFPLILRPFWDLWLPAPRNSAVVLKTTYDIDLCVTSSYCHSREQYVAEWYSVPCRFLSRFYPFVQRTTISGSAQLEQLIFNGQVIQNVSITDTNNRCI